MSGSTLTRRRTWRRAELVARFRRQAARLIPYLLDRPRWLTLALWVAALSLTFGALGAFLVIAWEAAHLYPPPLKAARPAAISHPPGMPGRA